MHWSQIFATDIPVLETMARGTAFYLALFCMFRWVLKRSTGQLGLGDVLLIVLVADASGPSMVGGQQSVASGLLLVATIAFWAMVIDVLTYVSPAMDRFLTPPQTMLVRDGKVVVKGLRTELVSRMELAVELEKQGITDISEVGRAYMGPSGEVVVVRRSQETPGPTVPGER